MAWTSSGSSNDDLVKRLRANKIIVSDRVYDTMLKVDRGHFALSDAYADRPQQIGFAATISAPHMHAYALEGLREQIKPGSHVLDVGSGSGYLTACFSLMVGHSGLVVGIEHVDELTKMATKNIKKWLERTPSVSGAGVKLGEQIKLVTGDGRLGWPEDAPYDAIHVGAAAAEIPEALKEQLKPGGRMIIPYGRSGDQKLGQIDRLADGTFKKSDLMSVMYVPLTDLSYQLATSERQCGGRHP